MKLSNIQTLIMIGAISLGTMITRFLPFFLFPENKEPPKVITYLGRVLPPAMMGLLVIYCLKDISFLTAPYGIRELLSILVIVVLHKWKHNVLLSIGGGTLIYMIMVQIIFNV